MSRKYNEVLRELRTERNLTQAEIAKIINISQRAYSFYEKGEREPSIDTILKLADYYQVPTDILLGRWEISK